MPGPKKKRITVENVVSTSAAASPSLPDQQEFHQHLRTLAQSTVQTVLETVMREELDGVSRKVILLANPKSGEKYY